MTSSQSVWTTNRMNFGKDFPAAEATNILIMLKWHRDLRPMLEFDLVYKKHGNPSIKKEGIFVMKF